MCQSSCHENWSSDEILSYHLKSLTSLSAMIPIRKSLNYVYKLLCICGCVYQIQNIVLSYFSFGKVTQNNFGTPSLLHSPSLHLCFRTVQDATSRSFLKKRFGIIMETDSVYSTEARAVNITVQEVFNNTPNSIFHSCTYRDEIGNEVMELMPANHCDSFFKTKKYVVQQYTCYQISVRKRTNYRFQSIASSLRYERALYEIVFKRPLAAFKLIRFILTSTGYPNRGKYFSPSFYKNENDSLSANVYCLNYTVLSLGYPYDAHQCDSVNDEHYDCYYECVRTPHIRSI